VTSTARPTALGWKAVTFLAALLLAFFAAPYQNLYFLLLAFLGAIGGLNVLWTLRNLGGVEAAVAPLAAVPAGVPSQVRFSVDGGRRDRIGLTASVELGERGRFAASSGLLRGSAELVAEVPALPRGIHQVSGASIESVYPLGLVRVARPVDGLREIVVHPAPASIPHAPGGGLAGLAASIGGSAEADQPSGVRDYRTGDEVRDVHWRATARRGRPVVTEWDATAGEGLELVLDRRASERDLEEALSLVAALTLAARETKERLTLHTQGLSCTFGPGHVPFDALLRFLAGADRLAPGAPPPPPAGRHVLRLPVAARSSP
jgi:uncharacterized protein (DUF58 family)